MAETAAQKKAKAIVEKLNAPTPKDAIKTRPGKGKSGALRYVDARFVMERLDEAVGPFGWTDSYRETDGGTVCTISITLDGEVWVPKSDVGTPSNIEGVKGRFSDAFKRAAVKWGIGRDLYEDETEEPKATSTKRKSGKSKSGDAADTSGNSSSPKDSPDESSGDQSAPPVGGAGLSQKQKGLLFSRLKELGVEGDQRKALVFFVVKKQSVKQMDGTDLQKVLEFLDEGREKNVEVWENIDLVSTEKSSG